MEYEFKYSVGIKRYYYESWRCGPLLLIIELDGADHLKETWRCILSEFQFIFYLN